MSKIIMDHIKTPLNKYTFKNKPMREYVETNCKGKVLNLFAGKTLLSVDEFRNDIDLEMQADINVEASELVIGWKGDFFDTVILDPPYSYRKSLEMYNGNKNSKFKILKDNMSNVLNVGGLVITFGYHSVSMGKRRGYELIKVAVFSHGGAIHDTICSIEKRIK